MSVHVSGFAGAPEQTFEAFGDSLTAGALSKYSLRDPENRDLVEIDNEITRYRLINWDFSEIGRKILFRLMENHQYSWSTGTKVKSVLGYYKTLPGLKNLVPKMRASVGETTAGVLEQIKVAFLDSWKNNSEIRLATVFVGGNNFCSDIVEESDLERSSQELRRGLDNLMHLSHAEVIMLDLPDPNGVRKLSEEKTWFGFQCKDVFTNPYFYCSRILGADINWAQEELKRWQDRWDLIGQEYERSYPGRFHYLPVLRNRAIEISNVAPDCFHFGTEGQNIVADQVIKHMKTIYHASHSRF